MCWPVLDKYCGKCHQGKGKGRKKFDMTPRPGHLSFDETYWILTGRPAWGRPYTKPADPPPGFGIALIAARKKSAPSPIRIFKASIGCRSGRECRRRRGSHGRDRWS